MSEPSLTRRQTFGILGGAILAGIGLMVVLYLWSGRETAEKPPTASPDSFSLPPQSQSPYLNTGPDSQYIGSAACAVCHPGNHKSYQLTAHSRALADLDPKAEPPDGAFDHKLSGRSYRIYRQDNQLHHEEVLRTAEGKEIARVDLPIRYVMGSGHYCRSYLVEVDGFLHESPITFYTEKNRWYMSPGYDFPRHWGFERQIRIGCVKCHAGRVEAIDGTVHKLSIPEKAIGCENCHGPGSTHQTARRASPVPPGTDDLTIIHPAKLSRSLRESICASCHLSGTASVIVRGRQATDFRPGIPLSDTLIHYRFDTGSDQMTVVGHVEQLRLSACYQKSEDMSCTTCHDPHLREQPKDRVAYHRQKCLDCHTTHPCRMEQTARLKKDPADNCAACHMPRGDTEIPHIAFTHHRIGKHSPQTPTAPARMPQLIPIDENPHLTPQDHQRNLGLAYLEISRSAVYARYASAASERAREHLEIVRAAGLKDGETAAALADIYWKRHDFRTAATHARDAIDAKDTSPNARVVALLVLADCERQAGNSQGAIDALEQLIRLDRFAEDWRLLGVSYLDLNQTAKALPAFNRALEIRPYRNTTHLGLAEVYRRLGDSVREKDHLEKANWLVQHQQD